MAGVVCEFEVFLLVLFAYCFESVVVLAGVGWAVLFDCCDAALVEFDAAAADLFVLLVCEFDLLFFDGIELCFQYLFKLNNYNFHCAYKR